MAAPNALPVIPKIPQIVWNAAVLTAANTTKDGTSGTDSGTLFIGGANGSRLDYIRVKAVGTNVATVLRVFLNNGSTQATAANNTLILEQTIAATTLTEVAALANVNVAINIAIPAGYKVFCTIGTAVAAGLRLTAVGGDY